MTAAASLTASSGRDTEAARQQAIVAALFAPERAAAWAVVAGAGVRGTPEAMEASLGAYRGNGIAIAERALQATYPVTFGLLGESAGSAAAHLWRADPPRTGDLADWARALPTGWRLSRAWPTGRSSPVAHASSGRAIAPNAPSMPGSMSVPWPCSARMRPTCCVCGYGRASQ